MNKPCGQNTSGDKKQAKKTYASPSLKVYGSIHLTTQGCTAAANGDAGQAMMAGM